MLLQRIHCIFPDQLKIWSPIIEQAVTPGVTPIFFVTVARIRT